MTDDVADHAGGNTDQSGKDGGVAQRQEGQNDQQGQDQVAAALDQGQELGHIRLVHANQTILAGFEFDDDVDTNEIQKGGDQGSLDHFGIADAHGFGHQESGSTHHRGHDLAAGGSGGFNGCGKFLAVAQLLHHGDGEGAAAHGIGHGAAGHRTFQGAGQHGHLGGAAALMAGNGIGKVDEEGAHFGALQECAKENKQENEGGGSAKGRAHDAFGGVDQLFNDLLDGLASVSQKAGHIGAKVSIQQENGSHAHDGQAHHTAAAFEQQHNQDAADPDIDGQHFTDAVGQLHMLQGTIQAYAHTGQGQDDIIKGQHIPASLLGDGENEEDQHHHKAQMQRTQLGGGDIGGKGGVKLNAGEENAQGKHDPLQRALEVPGDAFTVVFFHDGLHFAVGSFKCLMFFCLGQFHFFLRQNGFLPESEWGFIKGRRRIVRRLEHACFSLIQRPERPLPDSSAERRDARANRLRPHQRNPG